jgi:hypothetical protein
MAFWSAASENEARRNFKFLLTFGEQPTWVVKGINLPSITVGEATHHFLNHRFYFPGTIEYNTISFTVVDSINDEISQNIISQFVGSGYKNPGSGVEGDPPTLLTKAAAADPNGPIGEVKITQLGSGEDGKTNSISFALQNAWIKSIDFGQSLDYSNEDLSEIKVELRYDFFNFLDGDNPIKGFGGT